MSVKVTVLKTPVTVAFRKKGRKWYAVALQFDLVGIGSNREAALDSLKEMVNEYLGDCLEEKGAVELFFPSESAEWNIEDKQSFWVTVVTCQKNEAHGAVIPQYADLSELRAYRDRIESFDLLPTGMALA